ncbi:hypothetical protein BTJ44_01038 [Bacillus mycoides]|nr:hypothetical protein BTJ44_01038 [Bacillus mycoides]
MQERVLSGEKDYSIQHVHSIDVYDDQNGAKAFVDFKENKGFDYTYRMNNEGKTYQYSCSNCKCVFKEK